VRTRRRDDSEAAEPLDAAIEEYVDALTAALRGPARVKTRMVGEMRDSLIDAAAAQAAEGMPADHAAEQAVRDFGTLDDLVPACQRELAIAQARRTARTVAVTAPILVACCYLTWSAGDSWPLRLLVAQFVVAATGAALLAAATLATTGVLSRRLPTPVRLPLAVARTGTATGIAIAIAALTGGAISALTMNWTLASLAGVLAVAAHAVVAASARACRECARPVNLPDQDPYGRVFE
jgi:hypothetical protein